MMDATHEYRGCVFTIRYEARPPAHAVDFPDIPEIITSADTLTAAFENACKALDLHIERLQELGRRLPPRRHRVVVQA